MAKISGFFLSTLLVVLCFWLNVFSFPNVVQSGTSPKLNEAVSVEKETAVPNAVATPNEESATDENKQVPKQDAETNEQPSDAPEAKPTGSDVVASSSSNVQKEDRASAEDASSRQFAETSADRSGDPRFVNASQRVQKEDAVLKASSRAQGGKYVSIPSVGTDAFQSLPPAYADRVFGISFASATQDSDKVSQ